MRNRRNTIRLNESMLKRIIKESVKRVLRESNETLVFGLPLSIISDDNDSITIVYDGNEYTISKHGEFDPTSRYIYIGDKYYEDISFIVSDGYAICDGEYRVSKTVDEYGVFTGKDNTHQDVIEARFPKLRNILTNERLLMETLYYFADLNGITDEDTNILKLYLDSKWSKNVAMFFEGLFFGGGNVQWIVNGESVKDI